MNDVIRRLGRTLSQLFNAPLRDPRAYMLVALAAVAVLLIPLDRVHDYWLNTKDLPAGLAIYDNPDYVYPPWALIFLQPYRFMTVHGARIAIVLTVAAFMAYRGWRVRDFWAVMLNYFFFFGMRFTNIDVLVFVLMILVWEASSTWRYPWLWRGLTLPIFGLKPQGSVLVVLYLFWRERRNVGQLLRAIAFAAALTIPISLLGSPPLLLQWLDNISNPSPQNQVFWGLNNVSITAAYGLPLALIIVLGAFGASYWLLKRANRWTRTHTLASLLMVSMMLSPYTSGQSVIGALALVPSLPLAGISWLIGLAAIVINTSIFVPAEAFLGIGVLALWLVPLERIQHDHAEKSAA